MRGQPDGPAAPTEQPGFLDEGEDRLYFVHHRPAGPPAAKVLLLGPFGRERTHAYIAWVRWARRLAGEGFEALRFDYRGQGESTGRFEDVTVGGWLEDARLALSHLRGDDAETPVFVHGLRLGGLLASHLFVREGDALLLWSPPASAQAVLSDALRRKMAEEFMQGSGGRPDRRGWISALEAGGVLGVDGYRWSGRLWADAPAWSLCVPADQDTRPWLVVRMDRSTPTEPIPEDRLLDVRIPQPPFWNVGHRLVPDLSEVMNRSMAWLRAAVEGRARR